MIQLVARRALVVSLWFGALSAIVGGALGVFVNGAGVPLSYLQHTSFASYLIPGLALGIVIGGTQAAAAIALHRRNRFSLIAVAVAGFAMIIWIFVELAVISEYSALQSVYLALGVTQLGLVLTILGLLTPIISPRQTSALQTTTAP